MFIVIIVMKRIIMTTIIIIVNDQSDMEHLLAVMRSSISTLRRSD